MEIGLEQERKKKKKITLYHSSKRKAKTSISLWSNRKKFNTICKKSEKTKKINK